jgi:dUTP pyrophosphatase
MERLNVKVFVRPHARGLELPSYKTPGSAGMDLRAALDENGEIIIKSGKRAMIPTGLSIEIPLGWEAQVRPRSGLAVKHGITCLNTPGTIDSDYRGEINVILINLGEEDFVIKRGMRIAQMVFARHGFAALEITDSLSDSTRADGGFGSTGVH